MVGIVFVTLVNINRIQVPPIGPYSLDILGSALEESGHKAEVLDLTPANDPIEAIQSYFEQNIPDLVGITLRNTGDLYFPSFFDLESRGSFIPEHQRLIDCIKNQIVVERIILGGVGFSSNPLPVLKAFGLKYGVRGPGERVLVDVANALASGNTLESIAPPDGLFDGRKTFPLGKVKRKFVNNKWYYEKGGLGNVRTSNGCGMHCGYCVEPFAKGNGYYRRQIADVMDEIDQLVGMGIDDIHTADSEFNMPLPHSKEVLKAIIARKYPRSVRFWVYCQPFPFDEEYAQLLSLANVAGVNFGTDHADEQVLQSMGKWYKKEHIALSNKLCNQYGIAVTHDFLFGYPGDSPEKMFDAIDFVRSLSPWTMGVVVGLAVLPNTKLGNLFENKNRNNEPLEGFYFAGTYPIDPVFYVDPSFHIPAIFDELKDHIGTDIDRIMIPQVVSTSGENNQLVGSTRIADDLRAGKKGAYWYHYRNSQSHAVTVTAPVN